MSEFQASLLAIGALVVAGVVGYNKWQEHRARKAAQSAFQTDFPDALIEEPIPAHQFRASPPDEPAGRIEPGTAPQPAPREPRTASAGPVHASESGADYAIELAGDNPCDVPRLLEAWGAIESRFSRRAFLSGWIEGQWDALPSGGVCPKARAALQLVTRGGVLGEGELIEFRSGVETLAAGLGLSVAAPEMREALERARRLDQVCADADIQIAFHVVASPGETFAGTKLRAAAEAAGLVIDAEGRFALSDDRGRELFSLSDRSGARFSATGMKDAAPQALTLSMDVPRAPETQRTFEAMTRFARSLASLLGGSVVDDNGQPLDDRAVTAIGTQLVVVRASLEAEGIVPGSTLALRLFS